MRRDKLESIRAVYEQREQRTALLLDQARQALAAQQEQAASLRRVMSQVRDGDHATTVSPTQLARVQRFYRRVAETLEAQSHHVRRLVESEREQLASWHEAFRQRKAISNVLEERAEQRSRQANRKSRRATDGRSWSMLKEDTDNQENR